MWVSVNSGSWWWAGRPGLLRFMGSQSRTRLSDWSDLIWVRSLIHTWLYPKLNSIFATQTYSLLRCIYLNKWQLDSSSDQIPKSSLPFFLLYHIPTLSPNPLGLILIIYSPVWSLITSATNTQIWVTFSNPYYCESPFLTVLFTTCDPHQSLYYWYTQHVEWTFPHILKNLHWFSIFRIKFKVSLSSSTREC